ncbi:uncharacterized protein BJX67DRAFT_160306 [Aspergillus lucknowensis]|uniref:F-box domain-containing protein n=1 Tax=Aspergillus lucknowensis TaxID=176173 RepID=A0ABR4M456_9EURO
MLTPIRTRGRRKRPRPSSDGAPKPIRSGPKGGRPMNPPNANGLLSGSSRSKRSRLLVARPPAPKPREKLSRLESLPVELIEKIFLYSLNVNLPRSSHFLAAAVSSERIYRALTLLAFWNDSIQARLEEESDTEADTNAVPEATKVAGRWISQVLRPLEYTPLSLDQRRSFQVSILHCRWCTIHRIVDHLPDLMRLTVWRQWVAKPINMPSDQQEGLRLFLAQKGDRGTFDGTGEGGKGYVLSIEPLVSVTITGRGTDSRWIFPILGIFEIPDKFLRGMSEGFSELHTHFLELIRVSGGLNSRSLYRNVFVSREAIQQGVHMALVEHNVDALTTLLKIDEYSFRCENWTLPYTLPPEHFRSAVRVARDDARLFQLLIRASAESIPLDDSEITQWAMELDTALGPWLLDFMMELPQRLRAVSADPEGEAMFYLGRANAQCPIMERYLNDVLAVDTLDHWIGETSLDISSIWAIGDGIGTSNGSPV